VTNTSHAGPKPPRILVVDDTPTNIGILFELLRKHQFELAVAQNGVAALQIVSEDPPDLILLDVMMPEMDGFETCQRLKKNPQTAEIPVIFMTALASIEDKVKGLRLGAVDYITKPFEQEEVLARIRTHLTLQRQKNELQWLNQEKNEFLSIAAHDLKNPISAIHTIVDFMKMQYHEISDEQILKSLDMIDKSTTQMFLLINNLLDVNRIESGSYGLQKTSIDALALIKSAVQSHQQPSAARKNIQLRLNVPESPCLTMADEKIYGQIVDNLLSNAIKYSPKDQLVEIRVVAEDHKIRCEIQDHGPGLTDADQKRLFGKFARLSARPTGGESSTGLGLYIVKKLVTMLNGVVWCVSEHGKGATFVFTVPAA
jgi:signal transduction histidine kinase